MINKKHMARFNKELFLDHLTKLGNEKYLNDYYFVYLYKHNSCNFIMIDFKNFKKINDTYGHEAGDKCLIAFANKMRTYFQDSIVVRLHGDEFVVLTNLNESDIINRIKLIDISIDEEIKRGSIPIRFSFNAGISPATVNFRLTKDKADYMMYFAKKHNTLYQQFSDIIYQKRLQEIDFLNEFNNYLKNDKFSYYGHNLYNKNNNEVNLIQVYTKLSDGSSILSNENYKMLRKNSEIASFDMLNFQNLMNKISVIKSKDYYFITIDYKSLMSINSLIDFILEVKEKNLNGIRNIIISIDLSDIETSEYDITISIIKLLSKIGFKIRLDKVNNKISDYLILSTNPNFIKIATFEWKQAIDSNRYNNYLNNKINNYVNMCTKPIIIFDQIETINDKEFICNYDYDNILLSGNYYSRERKLKL